jgi:Cu-Zn family superoxide dismutase
MDKKLIAVALGGLLVASAAAIAQPAARATARLESTKGNTTSGTVTFTQQGNKVLVEAKVSGLKPDTEHGFHVHEKGDCSSGDGMSTGGHFNPLNKPHAHFSTSERHAGDLPALRADASGNATLKYEADVITVGSGPTNIIGRGLIVHAQPDDYKTQPTGNAGARLACGVIQN